MDDKPLSNGWTIVLRTFFGGLFAVPGMLLIGTGLGILDIFGDLSNGSLWGRLALTLMALPFISMGAMIALGLKDFSKEDKSVGPGVKHVLLLSFLVPLALFMLFTGFGPGEREFTRITTVGSEVTTGSGDELMGRFLFGGAGIFMTLIILLYTHNHFIKKK